MDVGIDQTWEAQHVSPIRMSLPFRQRTKKREPFGSSLAARRRPPEALASEQAGESGMEGVRFGILVP
jgi:hypothetical protein